MREIVDTRQGRKKQPIETTSCFPPKAVTLITFAPTQSNHMQSNVLENQLCISVGSKHIYIGRTSTNEWQLTA
jgi:hypothetical protein